MKITCTSVVPRTFVTPSGIGDVNAISAPFVVQYVVVSDVEEAKRKVRLAPQFAAKKMHIDGIQKLSLSRATLLIS